MVFGFTSPGVARAVSRFGAPRLDALAGCERPVDVAGVGEPVVEPASAVVHWPLARPLPGGTLGSFESYLRKPSRVVRPVSMARTIASGATPTLSRPSARNSR